MRTTRVSPSPELIVQQQACYVILLREWLCKRRQSPFTDILFSIRTCQLYDYGCDRVF